MPFEQRELGVGMTENRDPLAAAEENFLITLRRIEKEREQVLKMLDNLRKLRSGQTDQFPPVRENEYQGLAPVRALEHYFRSASRRDLRIPLSKVVEDLVYAGVVPANPRGKQTDPAALIGHAIRIAIQNRRETFSWEPEGLKGIPADKVTIWLAAGADQIKTVRRWSRKKGTAAS